MLENHNDKKYKKIRNINGFEFDVLKLVEELGELSSALMQTLTKPMKENPEKDVIEEMGDVIHRMNVVAGYYDVNKIIDRAEEKLQKSIKNIKKYEKI